ncbi:transglycosylase domain-containing protein [Microbacterium sp. ZW T5_56]|uniref:transglycosylase domain-containing protein n=1 Tax=Microbacterium sp. ZW T5_56 TaxID=3378081 RepID=UPI00385317A5
MPRTKRTASGVVGGLLGLVGLSAIAGVLVTATVTPAIAVGGTAATGAISMFNELPPMLEIDTTMLPSTFYAKDPASGQYVEMAKFYEQNRDPVTLDQVAPVMIDALLSSEDNRFYTHGGVDLTGTTRALLGKLVSGGDSDGGGSSITQQYVKNVLMQQCERETAPGDIEAINKCWSDYAIQEGMEGIERKLREMRYAITLEQQYTKEEILLGYLNIASWGGLTYGIEAAAQRYYSVPASQLNLNQAATLAGMVQSPNNYRLDQPENEKNGAADGYSLAKDRRDTVLFNLNKDGKITKEEYDATLAAPIEPVIKDLKKGCATAAGAEYFCTLVQESILSDPAFGAEQEDRELLLNRGGLKVYTTLDWNLQTRANDAMHSLVPAAMDGILVGSSGLNIEASTGRVLSLTQNTSYDPVGGTPGTTPLVFAGDYRWGDQSTGFSVGSTFKVFTLIDWLEKGKSLNEQLDGRYRKNFTSHCGDDSVTGTSENFASNPGYRGTPLRFTKDSLNTGFFAMAEQLDVCEIIDVAKRFGAVDGREGTDPDTSRPFDFDKVLFTLLGSGNVSPLGMGGAYAALANGGVYHKPRLIDSVQNADGSEIDLGINPAGTPVTTPEVAATALYALRGVMEGGGTGSQGNPYDGTMVGGKTGTHQSQQTWLIQTSSRVTSVAWVGQYNGDVPVESTWVDQAGMMLNNIRYYLGADLQRAADEFYPAPDFPAPDQNLIRVVYKDLPSVVGMTVDQATKVLEDAGFQVSVGSPVDADEAAGTITSQDPGAGKAAGGTLVTITPSNGKGKPDDSKGNVTIPDVTGQSFQKAVTALQQAGFLSLLQTCNTDSNAPGNGVVTGTNPAGNTKAKTDTTVTITYSAKTCG